MVTSTSLRKLPNRQKRIDEFLKRENLAGVVARWSPRYYTVRRQDGSIGLSLFNTEEEAAQHYEADVSRITGVNIVTEYDGTGADGQPFTN